jgi:hypothetical protein
MGVILELCVYRRLDNRMEGLPDDSPRALDLHEKRKRALHDVLDGELALDVVDWGVTDDARPHELVTVVVAVVGPLIVPGLKLLGEKLAEAAVDEVASSVVKWLIAKLRPKQRAKELNDFQVRLPDGTTISCDVPDRSGAITVRFVDGHVAEVAYDGG